MRVIGGKVKGFKLRTVPGPDVRPITDRVKESLFNILGPDVEGAAFWDLFAGTGSVGIEALSRGAAFVRFVDHSRPAIRTIQANLRTTELASSAEVLTGDSLRMLESEPDRAFEYVYIAPPQYKEMWIQALRLLDREPGWLASDAWVVAQIHPVEYEEHRFSHLIEFDRRKYGSTLLVFFKRRPEGE